MAVVVAVGYGRRRMCPTQEEGKEPCPEQVRGFGLASTFPAPPLPWVSVFSGPVFLLPVVPMLLPLIYPDRSQYVELRPAWNVGHRC